MNLDRNTTNLIERGDSGGDLEIGNAFFVDFETITDLNDDFTKLPNTNGTAMIYMIGCGYSSFIVDPVTQRKTTQWEFKNFIAHTLNVQEEKRIVQEWFDFMKKKTIEWNGTIITTPIIYHWSPAEVTSINAAIERSNLEVETNYTFFDLCEYFKSNEIVIKGCLNYRLKDVSRALYENKLINTIWTNSEVDGLGAMVAVWKCDEFYREQIQTRPGIHKMNIMKSIAEYNEIDCKVMWEIVNLLDVRN